MVVLRTSYTVPGTRYMLHGSGDDVPMTLPHYLGFSMPRRGGTALPSATGPPRPQDRSTPAPHGSARCSRSQRRTRRTGGVERSPPGDGLLGPRERSESAWREGFPTFSEAFPSRILFRVPWSGFQLYGRRTFRG